MKKLYLLIIIALSLFPLPASSDIYGKCVKGYDFGQTINNEVILYPLDPICARRCETECRALSQISNSGVELNSVAITQCTQACQLGKPSEKEKYYYWQEIMKDGRYTRVVRGPIPLPYSCSSNSKNKTGIVFSGLCKIESNTKLYLRLTGGNQKIYMCGKNAIEFDPIIRSVVSADWENKNAQTIWTSFDQNICLAMAEKDGSMSNIKDISNYSLWHKFSENQYKDPKYNTCRWHARNPNFIPTGLYPANGDDFSISWSGDFAGNKLTLKIGNNQEQVVANRYNILRCLLSGGGDCAQKLYQNSGIDFASGGNAQTLYGEEARTTPFDLKSLLNKGCSTPIKIPQKVIGGLKGIIYDTPSIIPTDNKRCAEDAKYACDNPMTCFNIRAMGEVSYVFSGALKPGGGGGLNLGNRQELSVRHHTSGGKVEENVGGYNILIDWGGCPITRGQNVQYAVIKYSSISSINAKTECNSDIPNIPDSAWKDLPASAFDADGFVPQSNLQESEVGALYFRIKPLSPPGGTSNEVKELYSNPGYRHGYYTFVVQTKEKLGSTNSPIQTGVNVLRDMIKNIKDALIGYKNPEGKYIDGAAQTIYKGIVEKQNFIQAVQAILALYIAITSIFFIMGLVNLSQKELLVRIIQISLVIMIISPSSWDFIYNNFLSLFIEGALSLIGLILLNAYPDSNIDIQQDPTSVFLIFDNALNLIFGKVVWAKLMALLVSGLTGLVIFLCVMIAVGIYIVCIAKAMVIFVFSLIGITLMIILTPIFIPLMLFRITASFFQIWWKLLLSFAMQPVLVFTTIAIFNVLLITLLQSFLNYTVCQTCFLYAWFFYKGECWIPIYRIAFNLHMPAKAITTFMPVNMVGAGLSLLLISHALWILLGFITQVASRLFSQMMVREATLAKPAESLASLMKVTANVALNAIHQRGAKTKKESGEKGKAERTRKLRREIKEEIRNRENQ